VIASTPLRLRRIVGAGVCVGSLMLGGIAYPAVAGALPYCAQTPGTTASAATRCCLTHANTPNLSDDGCRLLNNTKEGGGGLLRRLLPLI
jgi:hypothetical protein